MKKEETWLEISAITEQGLPELEKSILAKLTGGQWIDTGAASAANIRQIELLQECLGHVDTVRKGLLEKISYELVASDLKAAIDALGQITGHSIGDEILNRIFSRFCIGK
jgi:tRNA modification GTPase